MNARKSAASDNKVFTLRIASDPWSPGSGKQEADSATTSAPTKRDRARPVGLKSDEMFVNTESLSERPATKDLKVIQSQRPVACCQKQREGK